MPTTVERSPSGPRRSTRSARRAMQSPMAPLLLLSGVLTMGYGALFTIVDDYGDAYGISETTVGAIIGIGFIVSFVAQTVLGPWGDRGHARTLILVGSLLNIVGLLLLGFGTNATVLIIGRVISGVGMGAALPAIRRLVVVGSGEHLGRNLGRQFSADVFGFAIGPVISAVLVGPFGIAAPFLVIAAANAVVLPMLWRGSVLADRGETAPSTTTGGGGLAFDLLRERAFLGAVILGAAAFVMIGAFDALWAVVHRDLDTPAWMANVGITIFALPLVLLGPTAGKLAQRVGPFIVAAIGMGAASMFMAIYGMLDNGSAIFGVTMAHALTDGLSFAAAGVAVGMTAPESRQSGAQGVLGGMQSLAAGIMAFMAGGIYENYGQRAAYWTAAVLVAGLVVAGLLIAGPARTLREDR